MGKYVMILYFLGNVREKKKIDLHFNMIIK